MLRGLRADRGATVSVLHKLRVQLVRELDARGWTSPQIAAAQGLTVAAVEAILVPPSVRGRGAPTWAIFSRGGSKITSCDPSSARQ